MDETLVQLDADTWVKRGTAKGGWKRVKGRDLLVVSAEMPDGMRRDIDSSFCPFLFSARLEQINGQYLPAQATR